MTSIFRRLERVEMATIIKAIVIDNRVIKLYVGLISHCSKLIHHRVVGGYHFFIGAIVFDNVCNQLYWLPNRSDTNFVVGVVSREKGSTPVFLGIKLLGPSLGETELKSIKDRKTATKIKLPVDTIVETVSEQTVVSSCHQKIVKTVAAHKPLYIPLKSCIRGGSTL